MVQRERSRSLVKEEDFQERDSGWTMREIINLPVNINRYESLHSGFSTFVELLADIQEKKVNIKNREYKESTFKLTFKGGFI